MEVKRSYIETFYYAGKKKEDTVYQPIAVSQCVYVCVCHNKYSPGESHCAGLSPIHQCFEFIHY